MSSPPTPPYVVVAFSEAAYCEALAGRFAGRDRDALPQPARYLLGYLAHLQAATIVVEFEYTDGDYLDDVATYYVKSFADYPRRCRRLHFFSEAFSEEAFRATLVNGAQGAASISGAAAGTEPLNLDLQASYLGFIVVRPLPNAIIGRTVLATYDTDGGRRYYPAVKEYVAHLFGIELRVQSLAYQQQDTVLAACATVALWSAFQKTAALFNTISPTPAEITRAANQSVFDTRPLPSRGLRTEQMARAIREVGLEPDLIRCGPHVPLLSLLYGYLQLGLPVILGVDIEGMGGHAITVTGFSLRPIRHIANEDVTGVDVPRIGLRIDALYVHDDGVGPFARMDVHDCVPAPTRDDSAIFFTGEWRDAHGKPRPMRPVMIIAPVYHKIRLTSLDLQQWLVSLHSLAEAGLTADPPRSLEWRMELKQANALKATWRDASLPAAERARLLVSRLPRFIWCATLTADGAPIMEVLFDATGMARSFPGLDIVYHDQTFRDETRLVLALHGIDQLIGEELTAFLRENT